MSVKRSGENDQLPPHSPSPSHRTLPLRAAFAPRRRLEHLYNVKRFWLSISQLQSESRYLTPIPHLQWFGERELQRQVRLPKEGGFHTITINLQTVREKWVWERILRGLETVKDQYPEARPRSLPG
jgi:hypothetical protein